MTFDRYFQSSEKYFWQWEDAAQVLTIPDKSTIAYQDLVIEVLEYLTPQGIPPFGALLMTIIATNPKGTTQLDEMYHILRNEHDGLEKYNIFENTEYFLRLLTKLPPKYKQGSNRLLLFQAIFENCHNTLSPKKAKFVIKSFKENRRVLSIIKFSQAIYTRDFSTISLLSKRFSTLEAIMEKMASLPNFDENDLNLEDDIIKEEPNKDFITELIENDKSFYVGALVRRIWSGLNIPVHSALPSQQPLGGISDLTNKGDFDRLLLSEFANEDLVFLSRLANNEALFIQREIPPMNQNLQRIILIDISLKNWGTPRIIAFATMLAIAKHPKTNIECIAFTIGENYHPIDIGSVDTIIDALQILNGNLHAVNGLDTYFRDFPPNKNKEIFVITEPSTLKQTPMLKAMNEYHSLINYWIYTDAEGNIEVYKKQQNSKKHIQHLKLPLEELWKRENKRYIPEQEVIVKNNEQEDFPILFKNSLRAKKVFLLPNDEVFQITKQGALLKLYGNRNTNSKGWEMIIEKLPSFSGELELGLTNILEYILLMFNPQNRELILLNINTLEKKVMSFPYWKSSIKYGFIFSEEDESFYYTHKDDYWRFSFENGIERLSSFDCDIFQEREKRLEALNNRSFNAESIFKNINEVYINLKSNLVFNHHEFYLMHQCFQLGGTNPGTKTIVAKYKGQGSNTFEFPDGSTIAINPNGMFILKSSKSFIPTIYIPAVLTRALGVATTQCFAGENYYYKHESKTQKKIETTVFYQKYIEAFIGNIIAFEEKEISKVVESAAEYPGGQSELFSFLGKTTLYPVVAREKGIQGKVIVRFVVEKDGSIGNVEILQKVHPLLDDEAIRVIKKMPKWKPGIQNNLPVRSYFTLPIVYKLENIK